MLTQLQKQRLRQANATYEQICETIENFKEYEKLFALYFCKKLTDEKGVLIDYVFQEKLIDQNANFVKNWETKQEKIEARLKRNSYFGNGKSKDQRDLRTGRQKFKDLIKYYYLKELFEKVENNIAGEMTLEQYISQLKKRQKEIEKSFSGENKNYQLPSEPGA